MPVPYRPQPGLANRDCAKLRAIFRPELSMSYMRTKTQTMRPTVLILAGGAVPAP
ncbi:hypothetical protein Hsar01_00930 [Haloferula sargassicola]|uniref:Uncharacterized protein n=1 Tax=Haloferula sargassicola TaxID=490096 RepID=A0ABP9UK78_9BACT